MNFSALRLDAPIGLHIGNGQVGKGFEGFVEIYPGLRELPPVYHL